MPYQAMPGDEEVVRFAELHKLVGQAKVVTVFFGVDDGALHTVLGHDGIEVLPDNCHRSGIAPGRLLAVDGHAYKEFVAQCLL
jgi:hypothetical protein